MTPSSDTPSECSGRWLDRLHGGVRLAGYLCGIGGGLLVIAGRRGHLAGQGLVAGYALLVLMFACFLTSYVLWLMGFWGRRC